MTIPALPNLSLSNAPKALGFTPLAEMRGYYKEAACDFYAQLNPYKSYGKDGDEIGRQRYTLGDIGAWSTYGRHSGWLGCTVAHEIAHIRRNHVFLASY